MLSISVIFNSLTVVAFASHLTGYQVSIFEAGACRRDFVICVDCGTAVEFTKWSCVVSVDTG